MLTFSRGILRGHQAALRMAMHLSEPTMVPDLARNQAWLARRPHDEGRRTVPSWRVDLDPAFPSLLAVDPRRPLHLEEIAALLRGLRADGTRIPGKPPSESGYTDFTFSVEKDVSILWTLATPAEQAVIEAIHREAVQAAMAVIEAAIGRARLGRGGRDGFEAGAIPWLTFEQMTARSTAPDDDVAQGRGSPNLHVHVVSLHTVLTPSGRVRTPDLQGVAHRVHEVGALARALTARGLRRRGIVVEADPVTGTFRIPSLPGTLRDAFSRRTVNGREAAMAYLAETGQRWSEVSERRRVVLMKANVQARFSGVRKDDIADLAHWRAVAAAHGWSPTLLPRGRLEDEPIPFAKRCEAAVTQLLMRLESLLAERSLVDHQELRTIAAQVAVAVDLDVQEITTVICSLAGRPIQQDGVLRALRLITGADRRGDVVTHLSADLQPPEMDILIGLVRALCAPYPGPRDANEARDVACGTFEVLDATRSDRWSLTVDTARREGQDWCWVGSGRPDKTSVSDSVAARRTSLTRLLRTSDTVPAVILVEDLGRHHPRDLLRLLLRLRATSTTIRIFIRNDRASHWTRTMLDILARAWPESQAAGPAPVFSDEQHRLNAVRDGDVDGALALARQEGTARLLGGHEGAFARDVSACWLEERDRSGTPPVIVVEPGVASEPIIQSLRAGLRRRGLLSGPDHAVETDARTGTAAITLAVGDVIVLRKRVNAQRSDRGRGLFGLVGSRLTITGITREGIRAINGRQHEGLITWNTLRCSEGGYALDQGYVVGGFAPGGSECRIWAAEQEVATLAAEWLRSLNGTRGRDLLLLRRDALAAALPGDVAASEEGLWAALARIIRISSASPAERARAAALAAQRAAADVFRESFLDFERARGASMAMKRRWRGFRQRQPQADQSAAPGGP